MSLVNKKWYLLVSFYIFLFYRNYIFIDYFYSFLKLYSTAYAITVVPIFPLCAPPSSTPQSLRQSPHHCLCPWVIHISSSATAFPTLYFTSPWLFCYYLFVLLNPLTSSPIPPHPSLPSGNHQNALCMKMSSTGLLTWMICYLNKQNNNN